MAEPEVQAEVKPYRWNRGLLKALDVVNKFIFRISGGRLFNSIAHLPILMLTTTGRKSGQPRTHALTYWRDGDNLVVVASNGGDDKHPDWYFNLSANPQVIANIKGKSVVMTSRDASAEERARLWPRIIKDWHGYAQYKAAIGGAREIPIVILARDK